MEQTASLGYKNDMLSFEGFRNTILEDYKTAVVSREVSLLGRREVLTGKGKFGIFGDGKEVAQIAMAKFFQPGDFRSGYYRDQTFMFASGLAGIGAPGQPLPHRHESSRNRLHSDQPGPNESSQFRRRSLPRPAGRIDPD